MSFIRNLFSSPSAPSYPDPAQTIAAQSASNEATARLQAGLNRPDVYGPGGSTTWTDLGNDRWRSDVTLSPASQALYDQQMGIGGGMLGLAEGAVGQLPTEAFTLEGAPAYQSGIDYANLESIPGLGDFETSRQAAADAAFNRVMDRLNPQYDDQQRALETQLANEGFMRGSEGYTRAMDEFSRRRGDMGIAAGYDAIQAGEAMRQGLFANAMQTRGQGIGERVFDYNAANQARQQYLNEQLMQRNQQINELAAMLQGAPAIQGPAPMSGGQVTVQPTDVTGAYGLAQAANQNAYNQQMAQQSAAMGGLTSLGGAAIMGSMMGGP